MPAAKTHVQKDKKKRNRRAHVWSCIDIRCRSLGSLPLSFVTMQRPLLIIIINLVIPVLPLEQPPVTLE